VAASQSDRKLPEQNDRIQSIVMTGLVPVIHDFGVLVRLDVVDARPAPGMTGKPLAFKRKFRFSP
jgi:hypothetical protein